VQRVLLDCFCSALNPPCPPCDDLAVVLATLTVSDCEVTRICNSVRHHLLTTPNVEYWLPPIEMFRKLLHHLCCDLPTFAHRPPPCEQPCSSDIFRELASGNALRGIGIETDEIGEQLHRLLGPVSSHIATFIADEGWLNAPAHAASAMRAAPHTGPASPEPPADPAIARAKKPAKRGSGSATAHRAAPPDDPGTPDG
jgi:hypothetical protein